VHMGEEIAEFFFAAALTAFVDMVTYGVGHAVQHGLPVFGIESGVVTGDKLGGSHRAVTGVAKKRKEDIATAAFLQAQATPSAQFRHLVIAAKIKRAFGYKGSGDGICLSSRTPWKSTKTKPNII